MYKRMWNSDEKTVWEEYYFLNTGYHGVWRQWNTKGKLRLGFPRSFINNRKVKKQEFRRACKSDFTLIPYRRKEDNPRRGFPAEFLAQRSGVNQWQMPKQHE